MGLNTGWTAVKIFKLICLTLCQLYFSKMVIRKLDQIVLLITNSCGDLTTRQAQTTLTSNMQLSELPDHASRPIKKKCIIFLLFCCIILLLFKHVFVTFYVFFANKLYISFFLIIFFFYTFVLKYFILDTLGSFWKQLFNLFFWGGGQGGGGEQRL